VQRQQLSAIIRAHNAEVVMSQRAQVLPVVLQVCSSTVQPVKAVGQKRAAEKPSGASGAIKANQWDLSSAVMAAQAIRAGDARQAKRWLETDAQSRLGTEDRLREKLQASMGARGAALRVVVAGK
jgi:hypothetical protein